MPTRYDVQGDGPPLLLFSPGGFDAKLENWTSFGIYERLDLIPRLAQRYRCITFDRRELTWDGWADQGAELLDLLEIERAHVMGGCVGCAAVTSLAVAQPERVSSMVLYSPAGGPHYRMTQMRRFEEHERFVQTEGASGVVDLVRESEATFAQDPRVGPWATVLRADEAFASTYAQRDVAEYTHELRVTAITLFGSDAAPGPSAERLLEVEIPALIVPGNDPSHALSAAHYLRECLPRAEFWDVMPDEQNAGNAPQRVVEFLQSSDSPRSSAAI